MPTDDRLIFPRVGPPGALEPEPRLYPEELQLASRNRAMPLEALRWDITPTGMHYLLVHYDVQMVDAAGWRLDIGGAVERPMTLSLADLKARPSRTLAVTLQCAGDGRALLNPRPISQPWLYGAVGTAEWTGTPLAPLLEEAGMADDTVDVVFTALDRGIEARLEQQYERALSRAESLRPGVILAWAMNGQPLEPQHGAPVRLVAPGWYGMAHVKWLSSITAIGQPYAGYQNTTAYRYGEKREPPGAAVELMQVRSMMVPPGIPDFMTRTRVCRAGAVPLEGRAWSGRSMIVRVEVSADSGASWWDAVVDPPPGPHAWQRWSATWKAVPGQDELRCRATDANGATQPVEQAWTARGMGNNQAHRVPVMVLAVP